MEMQSRSVDTMSVECANHTTPVHEIMKKFPKFKIQGVSRAS